MNKVSKLDMCFHHIDAQCIRVVVKTNFAKSSPSPLVATAPPLAPSLIPYRKNSYHVLKVDQLADVIVILTIEEPTLPPVQTKMVQNERLISVFHIVIYNHFSLNNSSHIDWFTSIYHVLRLGCVFLYFQGLMSIQDKDR